MNSGSDALSTGRITGIFIGEQEGGAIHAVASVEAEAGLGLKGDRSYFKHMNLPAEKRIAENECTLIESESVAELNESGRFGTVHPGDIRRNLVTAGIRLNELVDRTFRVGEVMLRGIELCEPCRHLEKLTGKKIMKPLVHKAGLRASILKSGRIHFNDEIVELQSEDL